MSEHSISASELLMLLVACGGPVYALAALIQLSVLRRAGVPMARTLVAILGAIAAALPLTLFAWWASAFVPHVLMPWARWAGANPSLSVFVYISPAALLASLVAFPAATRIAKRKLGSDIPAPVIGGAA